MKVAATDGRAVDGREKKKRSCRPLVVLIFFGGFGVFSFQRGCPTQATYLQSVVDAPTRAAKMDMEERVFGVV